MVGTLTKDTATILIVPNSYLKIPAATSLVVSGDSALLNTLT